MKKPIKPTYTTRERLAIYFFGTCKRKEQYRAAMLAYVNAEIEADRLYKEEAKQRREYYRTHPEKPRASIFDRKPFEYARTIGIEGVFEHI